MPRSTLLRSVPILKAAAGLVGLLLLAALVVPEARAQDTAPSPEVAWSFDTGGPIWAGSTSRDGVVYVGSADGRVYALDIPTGKPVWQYESGGPVYSGVAVYDGYAYVLSDDGSLHKINTADGTEIWRFNTHQATPRQRLAPDSTNEAGQRWDYRASTPVEADGVVYVGSADAHFYAVDAEDATLKWRFETGDIIRSSPALDGDRVVFGSYDGRVLALDRETGDLAWAHQTGGPVISSPLIAGGVVYIGSRDATLYALQARDGQVKWSRPYEGGSWVESSATLYDGTLYVGSSDWDSALAIDPETGTVIWQTRLMDGGVYSTPAVTDDAYYTGVFGFSSTYQPDGAFVRVDRKTGAVVWTYPFEDLPDRFGHGVTASPERVDGLLLFGALDGTFYALQERGTSVGAIIGTPAGPVESSRTTRPD